MKLIKVEAHGFKSFADPISLKFDGGVVGVVGPNGSGKSNINDAIKWVLGERSAKELRGDNMEDVIFAGSQTAKPMNKAEVTLTFDNRGGTSSLPHDFITISRVLERGSGNNNYYLNGELCRQKDIKDIAMETGIGKSSLAIISQGTVSSIAESTPEERKAIFEEAAGVSKYKSKKKESLSKLESVQKGLDQINLVIAEIERNLVPLRKQAEKAKIAKAKKEELRGIEIALLVDRITTNTQLYEQLRLELEGVDETKNDLLTRIDNLTARIKQNETTKAEEEQEARKLSDELDKVKERYNNVNLTIQLQNAQHESIAKGQTLANKEEQIASYKALIEHHGSRIKVLDKDIVSLENKNNEKEKTLEQVNSKINEIDIKINQKSIEVTKTETLLQNLKQQKETHALLSKGTKTIVENKAIFGQAYKGTVADLIKVETKFISAIEAILGNAIQNIVVDKSETAVKAIKFLKENNGGKATFIPLGSIAPKYIRDDLALAIQGQNGYIGIAYQLVNVDAKFDILNKFLLGNVVVADKIENANAIAKVLDNRYMVVTLEGDVIRAGGVMTGGVQNKTQTSLGIDERIAELTQLLPGLKEELNVCYRQKNEATNSRFQTTELISEYKKQLHNLKVARDTEQKIFDQLSVEYKQIAEKPIELDDIELKAKSEEVSLETLESQKRSLEAQIKVKAQIISQLSTDIKLFNSNKDDFQKSLNTLNNSYAEKLSAKEKAKYILDTSRDRLAEAYNLTVEFAQNDYVLEMDRDQADEIVRVLREEIQKLGPINEEAIEKLEEQEKRYNEIAAQQSELAEAKATLEVAIAEMDKIITTRLKNIVEDVNGEFNNVFRSMLGGGSAELYFTDPKNILESGVDVKAQPPGKSVRNLKLFSGGEKSLIAISLLFGILKARPLPLCILDEVEAALDEGNVVRYAEYLQQLKPKTQFIVITHRHGTMSRVDALFAATMQNRGVSTFFSIEVDEAKKLVDDEKKDYSELEQGNAYKIDENNFSEE
ncbi:AAA family ATPase [Mycoplasmopsis iners]|uniref:AAA family ATPase n=1 Tax=Mycoplasmopsis iners TaxID=76630 RepID=UPI000690666D|nr:AAA family ATPase [Mycoplasmopsis iners]